MDRAESFKADITDFNQVVESTKESEVVYICAGLTYNHKIWAVQWPKIISNAIEACKVNKSKLIFFDNVYLYGKVDGIMTEETPYNPCTKKGEVRALISRMLEAEFNKGDVYVSIARAADLYGPYSTKASMLSIMVIDNLLKGENAQWLVNANVKHLFSYTMDCAKSLVLLSADITSYNQIWHLPTSNPEEFIELVTNELGAKSNYTTLSKFMVSLAGIFSKNIKEISEMLYQNEFDYYFDSSKFQNHFNYKPINYKEGIKETINSLKNNI